jgi:lysosomal alpha-mannosidase
MGSDFHYQEANRWFKNLDKLMTYANSYVSIFRNFLNRMFFSAATTCEIFLFDTKLLFPFDDHESYGGADEFHAEDR